MNTLISVTFMFLNLGLLCGLCLGMVLLLQPMTKRILSPRQQVIFWGAGWFMAYLPSAQSALGFIRLLPWTLRDLLVHRTAWNDSAAFLPIDYEGAGEYNIVFPTGGYIQVTFLDEFCRALAFAWLAGMIIVGGMMFFRAWKLRKTAMQGQLLEKRKESYGICEIVNVWLCDHIPTSFVQHWWFEADIFLQRDLPEARRELVLRHEVNHLKLLHIGVKTYADFGLVLYWWNPVIWLSYFAFCRALELDCDAKTMAQLQPEERKEYAKTLVELSVGRQMWDAPLSFGESDAAARVKAVVAWRPMRGLRKILTWGLTILAILFVFTGGPSDLYLPADHALNWSNYVGEDIPQFVKESEQFLVQRKMMPTGAHVTHGWLHYDGWQIIYELSTGTWRRIDFWITERGNIFHLVDEMAQPPDLTGFELIY